MRPFSPNVHFRRVVLSSSIPSAAAGSSFLIVAMYGALSYHLAFTRAGNTSWATLSGSRGMDQRIEDVVYHDGNFFCISARGQVQALDLTGPSSEASYFPNSYIEAVAIATFYAGYLASSSDDLLHVWKERDPVTKKTTNFTILLGGD